MLWCNCAKKSGVLPISPSQRPQGVPITVIQIKQTLPLRELTLGPFTHETLTKKKNTIVFGFVSTALTWWCLATYMDKQIDDMLENTQNHKNK